MLEDKMMKFYMIVRVIVVVRSDGSSCVGFLRL